MRRRSRIRPFLQPQQRFEPRRSAGRRHRCQVFGRSGRIDVPAEEARMDSNFDRRRNGMARLLGAASFAGLAIGLASPSYAQATDAQGQPAADPAAVSPATTAEPSAAQPETAGQSGAEIGVTGFRSSLAKALNLKQNENAAGDTILAEDIGKFPDLNLSESIQRIPGVAITRDGGEGRQITVRGLGSQFTRVRINGLEALTTAGGADASGGTNRSRSFDFNIFASDLFNAITVRKTAEASVDEGSLGATVDLRTARPFDYRGFTLTASLQGDYNDLANKVTPRGALLIADTFADGTLGALVSVAYTRRKLTEEGLSTVRWAPATSVAPGFQSIGGVNCTIVNGVPTPAECGPGDTAQHPRFPRVDRYYDDQKRLGITASLQWKPSGNTLVSLDGLYADFKGTREEQYLEAPSFSVGAACTAASRAPSSGIADT